MPPIRNSLADLTAARFRTAVLVGLGSIPFTIALSWESAPSSVSGTAVFLAGLLVGFHCGDRSAENHRVGPLGGYRYGKRPSESCRAGVLTGLVGSVPAAIWQPRPLLSSLWLELNESLVAVVVLFSIAAVIAVGAFVLLGVVGATVGEWLAERVDRVRDRAALRPSTDAAGPGRWRYVAAYVLLAPIGLLSAFEVWPAVGVGTPVAVASLFVLVPLSLVAFGALSTAVIVHRKVERDWMPNYWVYVGTPLIGYALVYFAATLHRWGNPSGDGVFGFLVALWLSSIVYLTDRHRHVGAP
ncbi:DUF5518 domain-containing protein [Natrinema salinisoli]|uniref:DUF5518 domain-containing protein n=1 Tax=Natrinema salinisoli TaxID=2878535 RepID=UPI001CF00C1C|nr:DUF5518 domain-containing protein [Natrinema salinisoli]